MENAEQHSKPPAPVQLNYLHFGPLCESCCPMDSPRTAFWSRLILYSLVVYVIFIFVFGILYLVISPSPPEFSVSSASVSPLTLFTTNLTAIASVSPFTLSSTNLTAKWEIEFSIRNRNKKLTAIYNTGFVSVTYGSTILAKTAISLPSQPKRNETSITVRLAAISSSLNDDAARGFAADLASGSIKFRVRILVPFWYVSCCWSTQPERIKVECPVGFSATDGAGWLSGVWTECEVHS